MEQFGLCSCISVLFLNLYFLCLCSSLYCYIRHSSLHASLHPSIPPWWPPTHRQVSSKGFCPLHQSLCEDVASGKQTWDVTKIYELIWQKSGFIWQMNKRDQQRFISWAAKWEPGMMEGLTSHDLVENSDCSDNGVEKTFFNYWIGLLSAERSVPVHQGQMLSTTLFFFFWLWKLF